MYEIKQCQVKNNTFFDVRVSSSGKRVARFSDEVMANNFANYLIRNMITTGDQWFKQPARIRNSFSAATGMPYPTFK